MDTPVVKLFIYFHRISTVIIAGIHRIDKYILKKQTMRILRYFSLRGLDGHHTRVYPRRYLGLVDYSEPHPYTTTDVSYRSVFISSGETPKG